MNIMSDLNNETWPSLISQYLHARLLMVQSILKNIGQEKKQLDTREFKKERVYYVLLTNKNIAVKLIDNTWFYTTN